MKQRHVPIRTCVVCREPSTKRELLRVVRMAERQSPASTDQPAETPPTRVEFDRSGKANGRGAYVCANTECIAKAIKQKRFQRSLNVGSVPDTLETDLLSAVSQTGN